jgi:hypothetical protein
VPYSGSANRDCGADSKPGRGPVCSGRRLPPASRRLDIAAAAVMENAWDEHSAVDPRPNSILDTARSNPADGVGMEVVQGAVMGRMPSGYCFFGE